MPLDALLKRLESDGEAEVARIAERSRAVVRETLEKAKAEAGARSQAILRKAEADAKELVRRAEIQASLEARRAMLAAKQDQIDAVFNQAIQDLANLPRDAYSAFLVRLLLEGAEQGDEEVAVSGRDVDLAASTVLPEVNRRLGESGRKAGLRLAGEPAAITAGVILRTARSITTSSVEALARKRREELEADVASILFGSGQER